MEVLTVNGITFKAKFSAKAADWYEEALHFVAAMLLQSKTLHNPYTRCESSHLP